MKKLFATLLLQLSITFFPLIAFAQINYTMRAEVGQGFSNFEKKETTRSDFSNFGEPKVGIRPQFSPVIGLSHSFGFGEKQNIGARLKMQFEQTNFTRHATFTYEDPVSKREIENRYQLNRLNLPVEFFFKVGKVRFLTGVINTWNIGGKVTTAQDSDWSIGSFHNTYEIGKTLSSTSQDLLGWSVSTSLDKKYSLQTTFGFDFPINNRWQFGASYRHSMTQSTITADVFDYDVFYTYEFQNQVNSILVSLSYLLVE